MEDKKTIKIEVDEIHDGYEKGLINPTTMIDFDFENKNIDWSDKVLTLSKQEIEFVLDTNTVADEKDLKILTDALNNKND